jgi:transcriptional regulator with XRE-family HTH domain
MRRKGRKASTLAKALVEAIHRHEFAGESRYGLAKRAGVSQAQLSRLVRGVRGSLQIQTVERLADAMGCEVILAPKRR